MMKLKDYAKLIAKLAKRHPEATVIYSADDEGNSYQEVHYNPSMGTFDGDGFDTAVENAPDAICIN